MGCSIIFCPSPSVSWPLSFSVSGSHLSVGASRSCPLFSTPFSSEMAASDKVLGKPRAAGRKRGQGTRAAEPRDRQ